MNEYRFCGTRKSDGAPIESRMRATNEVELKQNLADFGIIVESTQLLRSQDRNQSVSLGCGTLILIAIIVMMFSNNDNDDVQRELKQLRLDLQQLKVVIETQTRQIEELRAGGTTSE